MLVGNGCWSYCRCDVGLQCDLGGFSGLNQGHRDHADHRPWPGHVTLCLILLCPQGGSSGFSYFTFIRKVVKLDSSTLEYYDCLV